MAAGEGGTGAPRTSGRLDNAVYWAGGALGALELAAYGLRGGAAWLALAVWAGMGVATLVTSVAVVGRSLAGDLRERRATAVLLLAAAAAVAFWGIGGTRAVRLNLEGTQQVAAALTALHTPAWGYTGTLFIGYPARQFLPVALPTLLLGRNLVSLRLGFALAFVGGLLLFHAGLKRAWAHYPVGADAAALTCLACLAFPLVPEEVRTYEQSMLPLALVLGACGWLLLARETPTPRYLIPLVWFGALLGTSYTPALAAWLLLLAALAYLGRRGRAERIGSALRWRGTLLAVLVIGAASFLTRFDVLPGSKVALRGDALSKLGQGMSMLFAGAPRPFVPAVLALPVLAFLLLSLAGRTNRPSLVVAWWTVVTVAAAVVLPGYAAPPPDVAIHRAVVAVPPLLLAMVWTGLSAAGEVTLARLRRAVPIVAILLAAGAGWALIQGGRRNPPAVADRVWEDLLETARRSGAGVETPLTVVALSEDSTLWSLGDGLRYFFPAARFSSDSVEGPHLASGTGLAVLYADPVHWDVVRRALPANPEAAARVVDFPPGVHRFRRVVLRDGVPAPS
jgi:hypothetical protein